MRHSSSKPCVTCPIRVLCLHLRVPRWSLINESLKFEHAFRLSSHRQAIIVKLQAASLDCTEMIQNLAVVCCCPLGTTSGEKKLKLCGCGCAEGPNLSHDHKIAQPSKRWEKDRNSDLPSLPPQTFTTIYKLSAKKVTGSRESSEIDEVTPGNVWAQRCTCEICEMSEAIPAASCNLISPRIKRLPLVELRLLISTSKSPGQICPLGEQGGTK